MKHNWEYKRLGDVCEFFGGGTPSKKIAEYYTGNIPWATVRDMVVFNLSNTEFSITKEAVDNSATNILPKGMIVISTHVGLGKICQIMQDTAINQDLKGVSFRTDEILKMFFVYWYKSIADYIVSSGRGATVKGVTLDFIKSLRIPVPPMEIQERIVAELDKINELIETKREQLKHLDSLAQSLFYDTFGDPITNPKGWETYPFGKVCNLSAGGDKPSDTKKERGANRYIPVFSNGIENEGLYGYTSIAKVSEPALTISGRGTLGVPFIRLSPFVPIIRLIVAIPSQNLLLRYLYYLVKSLDLKGNGVAIPQLTVPMIKNIQIPVPPLSLQQQFAMQIEAIEAQKAMVEKSIAELQTLLDSRMDYWFN